jgi:Fe2+ or Zn2+ uptake regulation protein
MSELYDYKQLIIQHGFRLTAIRLAILEILGAARRAMTAPEILAELKNRRRADKVTVYRILEDFSLQGIIRKLAIGGRASY